MAERRMFTMKIMDSDAFLDMPLSAQALYVHLCMRADDDGFTNNPRKIQRVVGATEEDLELLIAKRFVLVFDNGVIVIKHWRMHNILKKDRYHETQYTDEKNRLEIKKNGAYTEKETQLEPTWNQDGTQLEPTWNQDGTQLEPQDRIGKDSIYSIRDTISPSQSEGHRSEMQKVIEEWNKLPVLKVSKMNMSSKRGQMLKARIEEYGIGDVLKAVESISRSSFLTGQNTRGWMITFDWFVKPNNFPKVLEGNYLDKDPNGKEIKRMSDEQFAALAAAHEGADPW